MSALPSKADMTGERSLQTNHTTWHGIEHHKIGGRRRNAEPEHTLSYGMARANMRILELENRCTGNRTVGSNPPQWSILTKG
jgi:hypothetical protein